LQFHNLAPLLFQKLEITLPEFNDPVLTENYLIYRCMALTYKHLAQLIKESDEQLAFVAFLKLKLQSATSGSHCDNRERAGNGIRISYSATRSERENPAGKREASVVREHIADTGGRGPTVGHGDIRSVETHSRI
jgi:hypothetical protein